MDCNLIEYFLCVAKTEHMSNAADELFVSQSTLSLAIKSLEKELGVPLFDRVGRNIRLNRYGNEFYHWALQAKEIAEKGKAAIDRMVEEERMTLNIISAHLFTLGGLLEDIYNNIPGVKLNCEGCDYREVEDMISQGKADIGFLISPIESKNCNWQTAFEYHWTFLISENHPLAQRESISLKECKDLLFVAPSPSSGQRYYFDRVFEQVGYKPKIVRNIDSYYTTLSAVSGGHVAALFGNVVLLPMDVKGVKCLRIEDELEKFPLRIYWPNDREEKPAAVRARKLLLDAFSCRD